MSRAGALLRGLGLRLVGIGSLGCILYALSELAFYPLPLQPDLAIGVLAYGVIGWSAIAMLAVARRWDRAAWWLAAGMIGFLAEGVLVAELYTALPLTLVWTPLAWHALVTVFGGLLGFRAALVRGALATLAFGVLLGGVLGLWGGWMWAAEELPGGQTQFDWPPVSDYAVQLLCAWVLLSVGHWGWNRVAPRVPDLNLRADLWSLTVLLGTAWAFAWAAPMFPWSLLLIVLVAATAWGLRGTSDAPQYTPQIGVSAWIATAAMPAAAILIYAVIAWTQPRWETNVVVLIVLGLPAVALWLRALLRPGTTVLRD
ncbi:hypothetical protein JANAI62_05830 [Jannaschia pagri]|uniref:DUF2157 domain-containing protein n=1 Tax=Jannaschia pagri TaxID=2829797 RepID=A0ABQ4NID1_9RHOB|nr:MULTISPECIES: hypothetical protein [unclassified Jannaschia]GIT89933.1 hypothetical protein JANAI61_03910 [Jannaschia sp. AI_61]GIT93960.1 hypothetical protein JANAI62_05830 [Jannaschia sp. AI_62]